MNTSGDAPSGSSPSVEGSSRPPNVLVVVLDCARAKSFGMSGRGPVASTPVIDALARSGTAFPQAVAPANWTVPSHMSIFTGLYPNVHGVRTFRRGEAPRETMASWLGRRGYETSLFTEMVHLVGEHGLESGYTTRVARHVGLSDEQRTASNRLAARTDALYSPKVRRLIERLPPFIVPLNMFNHPQEVAFKRDVCGGFVVDQFDAWLKTRQSSQPFFSFINLVDAHEPYPVLENGHRIGALAKWYARTPRYYLLAVPGLQELVPWPELLRGYLWSIEEADRKVGRLLAALDRAGERDRTLVIVTADHGQSFGEGGNVYHGCGATDSITRVPLVVAPPRGVSVPARVDRWVSLCEMFSWLKAAASGREPYGEDGRAPFPFSASAPSDETVFCEGAPASDPNRSLAGIRLDASWNHRLLAAYRPDEKLVLDLVTGSIDRWRLDGHDVDQVVPERYVGRAADELRARVFGEYETTERSRRTADAAPGAGDSEIDRRLRSWGYD